MRLGDGAGSLLKQWIAKYGYVPIVLIGLIGMAGLAPEFGTGERKSGDRIVAEAPVVAEPPVVAETFVERSPPTVEIKVEPKPTMQLTAPVMRRFIRPASAAHGGNQSRANAYDTTGGTQPGCSIAGSVRSAGVEGLHHVRQFADGLDAGAVARRDQLRPRPTHQQHTRRD